jgi:DNA helicase-2/ATP-dependent DNA helicase PcrA
MSPKNPTTFFLSLDFGMNDLKKSLVALIKQEIVEGKSGIKYSGEKDITLEYFQDKEINYKDYRKIDDGILWHDDILKISNYMFNTYPLLCDILKDKYKYILNFFRSF